MENRDQLVQNIVQALASTLNPNKEIRHQAEAFIKQVRFYSSFYLMFIFLMLGRESPRLCLLSLVDFC
jgi:hypothetical protein